MKENFYQPLPENQRKNPEIKNPEHLDEETLKTIAHFWVFLLKKKDISPEHIANETKKWPDISEYTDEEIEGLFRRDPEENKKFWEQFKKDWEHIENCIDCSLEFEQIFWSQFR